MRPYTYLMVDLLTVVICFAFSFHPKIRFDRYFTAFLKAFAIVGSLFIAWDIGFTAERVWWFDTNYTIGINIAGLPIEEWLFFVCIPFSCLFTFFCLDQFFDLSWADRYNRQLSWLLIIVFAVVAMLSFPKTYPFTTATVAIAALMFLQVLTRANWTGRATIVYLVLMLGFIPVNGILTGTGLSSPIVNYNTQETLNIRLLTIPVEDFVYGYALFLLYLYFFRRFSPIRPVIH